MSRQAAITALRRMLREEFRSQPPMTVSWRPERIERDMEALAGKNAYAATIAPEDFLGVTSRESRIRGILDETGPLDMERLSRLRAVWPQETPFLNFVARDRADWVDTPGETLNVGHEGRHRTTALGRAGARRVPVVLRPMRDQYQGGINAGWRPRGENLTMHADKFTGEWGAKLKDVTPYTPENYDRLLALGGRSKNHITYSLTGLLAALSAALGGAKARDNDA